MQPCLLSSLATWRRRFRGCTGTHRLITSRLQVSNDNAIRHKIEHSSVVYGRACRRTRDRFEVQTCFNCSHTRDPGTASGLQHKCTDACWLPSFQPSVARRSCWAAVLRLHLCTMSSRLGLADRVLDEQ